MFYRSQASATLRRADIKRTLCRRNSAQAHRLDLAAAVLCLLLAALALLPSPVLAEDELTEITLRETVEGRWFVEFAFPEPQRALVFRQAPEAYRAPDWTSQTEGVEVVTIGQVDAMVFESPGRSAIFEIEPFTDSLEKAYTPFLSFSDGSWGVLEGQFRLSTAAARDAVEAFSGTGESWEGEIMDYALTVESPRRIFHGGEWAEGELTLQPESDGTYLYVGDADIQQADNFAGFIDAGLPEWIRRQLDDDLAEIFSLLSEEWGLTLEDPVEILFVFDGADGPGLSQTGGVLGPQIALQVSGEALLEPDTTIVDFFRWFLTHESVHVFQRAAGMDGIPSAHAWMHEGVANTMAHRIGARLAGDPELFLREVYSRAFAECVEYLETGTALKAAIETGQFGVYYSCGDFIALLTEARLADGDIFDFWKAFLAEATARGDKEISVELYFELAADAGLDQEEVVELRALVDEPVPEARQQLIALLESAGLEPRFNDNDRLESLKLPK